MYGLAVVAIHFEKSAVRRETEFTEGAQVEAILPSMHCITSRSVYSMEMRDGTETISTKTEARLTRLFLLKLLTIFTIVTSQQTSVPDRGCVSSFQTARSSFEICKTKLCFIILRAYPHVLINSTLESAAPQPFLCRDHDIIYPKTQGLFFDVLRGVSRYVPKVRDARCVFGGKKCSFDNSVRFVEDIAKNEPSYQFVASGYLLFLFHRRTKYTVHSQPYTSDKMVVVFLPENTRDSFAEAWKQVFQPFSVHGWAFLFGMLLIFLFGIGLHAKRFSGARGIQEFVRWFILPMPVDRGVWETASWNSLKLGVAVFFAVLILLYELSIVNFILTGPELLVDNIQQLKTLGLKNFAVVKEAASETIFKYAAGLEDFIGTVPWVRGEKLDDIIDMVMEKRVKYAFSSQASVSNMLYLHNLCDKVVAVPTEKTEAGGWYYGTNIPMELRSNIDKALSKLVLEQKPKAWRNQYGESPLSCGRVTEEIDHKVIMVLLALTVGPFLLKHFVSMALSCCWTNIEHTNTEDIVAEVTEQSSDSSLRDSQPSRGLPSSDKK